MDFDNPIYLVACYAVAILLASLLGRWKALEFRQPRNPNPIDGLRGLVAFGVFVHHGAIWYGLLATGAWKSPSSHLYAHAGESSVAIFFMITAFLFWGKVLDSRARPIDWTRFFVARILRLAPLYLAMCALVFATAAILTSGALRTGVGELLSATGRWLLFTIPGGGRAGLLDLNGLPDTSRIVASAMWSLPFEWVFYFALPVLALAVRRPPVLLVIGSGAIAWGLYVWHGQMAPIQFLPFVGGLVAAHIARIPRLSALARTRPVALLALAVLALLTWRFPTIYGLAPIFLVSCFFVPVACGNGLFGLLLRPACILLGEISYGIYLLHGFLLFLLFGFLTSPLPPLAHWGLILGAIPVLLGATILTHLRIERPALSGVEAAVQWLRTLSRGARGPNGTRLKH